MQVNGIESIPLPYRDGASIKARRTALAEMLEMTCPERDKEIPALCVIGFASITEEDITWAKKALRNE